MNIVRTRYMVNDIAEAVSFYTKHLGFQIKQEVPPNQNFAMIARGDFVMVLSTPFGSRRCRQTHAGRTQG